MWEVHRVPPTMSYHFDCQVNEDQLAHQHRRQGASDTTHDACPLCKGQQGAMARPPHPFHLELEEATPTSHLSMHLCSDSKCGVVCHVCFHCYYNKMGRPHHLRKKKAHAFLYMAMQPSPLLSSDLGGHSRFASCGCVHLEKWFVCR